MKFSQKPMLLSVWGNPLLGDTVGMDEAQIQVPVVWTVNSVNTQLYLCSLLFTFGTFETRTGATLRAT